MKKIIDRISILGEEDYKSLALILNPEKPMRTREKILPSLFSYAGLQTLLSSLNSDELKILSAVYRNPSGLSFGEIEAQCKMDIGIIESLSVRLSKKLLIYILKNRQRIHNKNDKAHPFEEIGVILNPVDSRNIRERFDIVFHGLLQEQAAPPVISFGQTSTEYQAMEFIISRGSGMITLEEYRERFPEDRDETALKSLIKAGTLQVFHELVPPVTTHLVLSPSAVFHLMNGMRGEKGKKPQTLHNGHNILLNLLHTFDIITTYGLFLTKQKVFRKVDRGRLMPSPYIIQTADGKEIPDISQLSLHLLSRLKLLHIQEDAALCNLKPLEKELDKPRKIIGRIFRSLEEEEEPVPDLFQSPIPLPAPADLRGVVELLHLADRGHPGWLKHLMQVYSYGSYERTSLPPANWREERRKQQEAALNLLLILGIAEITDGFLTLSDTGREISSRMLHHHQPHPRKNRKDTPCIYINPDFTLLVPRLEVPSDDLYHILTHTEIIREDVVLHARISKGSILKACKRGMSLDPFLQTLQKYSRNEIPQNLSFLLKEWEQQAVRIRIVNCVLLHSNHATFIDDLQYGKLKKSLIEVISPNHALVRREHLDDIIKLAQQKDAIVSLFEDNS